MKKLLTLFLALALVLSCVSFAMAETLDPEALSVLLCGDDSLADLIDLLGVEPLFPVGSHINTLNQLKPYLLHLEP